MVTGMWPRVADKIFRLFDRFSNQDTVTRNSESMFFYLYHSWFVGILLKISLHTLDDVMLFTG